MPCAGVRLVCIRMYGAPIACLSNVPVPSIFDLASSHRICKVVVDGPIHWSGQHERMKADEYGTDILFA